MRGNVLNAKPASNPATSAPERIVTKENRHSNRVSRTVRSQPPGSQTLASGDGSRVIAFEPNPTMIGRLGHNIALNNLTHKVRIEGCALSDREGEAILNFRGHNYGQASLIPVPGRMNSGGVLVPTRPLSAFTHAARHHDFTVLKIDVEGAEEVVLNPMLDQAKVGGWLPDAMLVEVRHADQWDSDLCARILNSGFRQTMRAEGNALYIKKR